MSFKLDLSALPPPITIKFGDSSFVLRHSYMTAIERGAAMEAIGRGSFSALCRLCWQKLLAWEGITDNDGVAIPMRGLDRDGNETSSNVPAVMGRVPHAQIVRAVYSQLAINGVQLTQVREIMAQYIHDAVVVEAIAKEVESFFPSPSTPAGGS